MVYKTLIHLNVWIVLKIFGHDNFAKMAYHVVRGDQLIARGKYKRTVASLIEIAKVNLLYHNWFWIFNESITTFHEFIILYKWIQHSSFIITILLLTYSIKGLIWWRVIIFLFLCLKPLMLIIFSTYQQTHLTWYNIFY